VKVVCAAGFYWDPFPEIALASSVEEIRDAMIAELEAGTDGTDVRCGVIKVGTAQEPNEPAERLFKAAALASRATGAGVITHTSNTGQAAWHIRVLEGAGMDMTHAVISHMGAAKDISELVEVGRCGAFMGIDKVSFPKGPTNVELADLVRDACDKGLERQLILSSDVARRTMLSRYGGKGYPTVLRDFVPMLSERGIPDATIETMLSDNPSRMLTFAA
jgi:phosphotriesterase-related protein